jgi:hypothetical protein
MFAHIRGGPDWGDVEFRTSLRAIIPKLLEVNRVHYAAVAHNRILEPMLKALDVLLDSKKRPAERSRKALSILATAAKKMPASARTCTLFWVVWLAFPCVYAEKPTKQHVEDLKAHLAKMDPTLTFDQMLAHAQSRL